MGIDLLDSFDRIFDRAGTSNPNDIFFEGRNARQKKKAAQKAALNPGTAQPEDPATDQSEGETPNVVDLLTKAFKTHGSENREKLFKHVNARSKGKGKPDPTDFDCEVDGVNIAVRSGFDQWYQYDEASKTLTVNLKLLMKPYMSKNKARFLKKTGKEDNTIDHLTLFDNALIYAIDKNIALYESPEDKKTQKDAKKAEKDAAVPPKEEQPKQDQPTEQQPTQEVEPKKEDDIEGPEEEEEHSDHEWFNIIAEKFDKEYTHDLQNDVEPGMSDDDINDLGQTYYDDLMPEYDDKVSDGVKQKVYTYIVKRIKKEAGPAQSQNPNQNNPNNDKEPEPDDFKWGDGDDGDDGDDQEPQKQKPAKPEKEPKEKTDDSKPKEGRFNGLLGWIQNVGAEGGAANFSDGGVQATTPSVNNFSREEQSKRREAKRQETQRRLAYKKQQKILQDQLKQQKKKQK